MDGNHPDFKQVYADFQPRILRYLRRMVGESEAEDLTQEVFARVATALDEFRGESQLSTWLYRIATNAALDRLRAAPRAGTIEPAGDEEAIADRNTWTGAAEPMVVARIYRQEMNDCIRGFVERLPDNYRTALLLADFEGLKNEEIARVLDLSVDTVKIRLHRARERLKNELIAHCGPEWIEGNEFLPELR